MGVGMGLQNVRGKRNNEHTIQVVIEQKPQALNNNKKRNSLWSVSSGLPLCQQRTNKKLSFLILLQFNCWNRTNPWVDSLFLSPLHNSTNRTTKTLFSLWPLATIIYGLQLIIYCHESWDSQRNKTFICNLGGMQTLTFNYIPSILVPLLAKWQNLL